MDAATRCSDTGFGEGRCMLINVYVFIFLMGESIAPITCSSLTFHSFDETHDEPHPRPSAGDNGLAHQEDEHINANQHTATFPKARI